MRTPNRFLPGNRFINSARWVERSGPCLLWPSAWVEWSLEPVLGVHIHRWTLGFAYWRVQLDWGCWNRRDQNALIDWRQSGLDGFLSWSRQAFGHSWGRGDLDQLFKSRPEWRRLVGLGDGRAHYIRLLLARELASTPESRLGPSRESVEDLDALETALSLDGTDNSETEASRTVEQTASPPRLDPDRRAR